VLLGQERESSSLLLLLLGLLLLLHRHVADRQSTYPILRRPVGMQRLHDWQMALVLALVQGPCGRAQEEAGEHDRRYLCPQSLQAGRLKKQYQ